MSFACRRWNKNILLPDITISVLRPIDLIHFLISLFRCNKLVTPVWNRETHLSLIDFALSLVPVSVSEYFHATLEFVSQVFFPSVSIGTDFRETFATKLFAVRLVIMRIAQLIDNNTDGTDSINEGSNSNNIQLYLLSFEIKLHSEHNFLLISVL